MPFKMLHLLVCLKNEYKQSGHLKYFCSQFRNLKYRLAVKTKMGCLF